MFCCFFKFGLLKLFVSKNGCLIFYILKCHMFYCIGTVKLNLTSVVFCPLKNIFTLILRIILWDRYCQYPHVTKEKNKLWGLVIHSKPHSWKLWHQEPVSGLLITGALIVKMLQEPWPVSYHPHTSTPCCSSASQPVASTLCSVQISLTEREVDCLWELNYKVNSNGQGDNPKSLYKWNGCQTCKIF